MNLPKLFEMQRQLDEYIEQKHPRQEGEDRLAKKILALMVELGELANEWRGFKFWSHDQVPRTRVLVNRTIDDIGFKYIGPEHIKNLILEEYVDCLHFLLSIGNDINMNEAYEGYEPKPLYFGDGDILGQFIAIYDCINSLYFHRDEDVNGEVYDLVFAYFLGLGKMFYFTWEQVEEAYMKKNAVNHERQEMGY